MQVKGLEQCLAYSKDSKRENASKPQRWNHHWEPSALMQTSFFCTLLLVFFFTYNFKSFDLLKCDYIHAEWWRKGCGRINSALLLGSCFLSLFHRIWHGVVVEVTCEFLHRLGTGLGLMRRKVPLKGTPHGAHPILLLPLINGLFSLLDSYKLPRGQHHVYIAP